MISISPARRRAEEFATLVDGQDGPSRDASTHADLLDLVASMRSVTTPEPRPEFVSSLRERLMVEADTALSATGRKLSLPTHSAKPRDRRLAVLAGTVAAIGATSSVAVAAQGALPGDTLYPIKRAIEGAQTNLAMDDAAKAETMIDNARGRLAEVEKLARQIDAPNTTALPQTLLDFSRQSNDAAALTFTEFEQGGDIAPLEELRAFSANSMVRLGGLEALLPSNATDALNNAVETLLSIDSRVASLCPECEGTLLEVPTRLLLSLRSAETAARIAPSPDTPSATPSDSATATPDSSTAQPDQVVGADVIDVDRLEEILAADEGAAPDAEPDPTSRERAEKAAEDLQLALNDTGDALLGEDGLLGPVVTPLEPILDPLVGPVLGKGGLLNP